MSDNPWLNWALITVSLFNTILLLWLGLTVLLNADRRAWGIWLGGGGLLLGAIFFLSHTALLGLGLSLIGWNMIFWWTAGLVPALVLPFAWYVAMLWYAGYWEGPATALRRRQRPWLGLASLLLALGLLGLALGIFLLATPTGQFTQVRFYIRWSIAGIPLMALGYSFFVILCIGLSLDALRQPGPSIRVMGQVARQRARPWLMASSITLLLVSLLVAGTMAWLVQEARGGTLLQVYGRLAGAIARLDLAIASLIAAAILLLGQAVVSYEVFTGQTLPRRGLTRHWQRAIVLATGYSVLVTGSFAMGLRPLYTVILATALMTVALAVVSWRSYAERQRYIQHLRPFLISPRLYDQMLAPDETADPDIAEPFATLCRDVLDTRCAFLVALGPLAPLVGPPQSYPADLRPELPALPELATSIRSPETLTVLIDDPPGLGGAVWAVPLWSQRGLSGVLLLGEKRDGGLYGQEEMEVARLTSERLLDAQASAEMGRRLVSLQRQRLAQSQMADLLARRVLHDEVLPNLQSALIALNSQDLADGVAALLSDSHRKIADLLRQIPTVTTADLERLGFLSLLQQAVANEFQGDFDEISWHIDPEAASLAGHIPAVSAEVLFYATREAIRNAARHGRAVDRTSPFSLRIAIDSDDGLAIVVEDNGVGLAVAGSAATGAGQGLALYSTMMAVIGGTLSLDSLPNRYTRVRLSLPEIHEAPA